MRLLSHRSHTHRHILLKEKITGEYALTCYHISSVGTGQSTRPMSFLPPLSLEAVVYCTINLEGWALQVMTQSDNFIPMEAAFPRFIHDCY